MTLIEEMPSGPSAEEFGDATSLRTELRFRGENGTAFVAHVLGLMEALETRVRHMRGPSLELRRLTVEVLLSNLAAAALNWMNPQRFVAVTFHRPRYSALGLSYDAMVLARNALLQGGLMEHYSGYNLRPAGKDFRKHRRAARLRATDAMRELFDHFEIRRRTVKNNHPSLIMLNGAKADAGPEPVDVTASRTILARINARIDAADLEIPEAVWTRMRISQDGAPAGEEPTRFYRGDQTAKSLHRVFTGDWNQGGRLYGGWWLGLTQQDRLVLRIDGAPTVEIDFRNWHPTLLYSVMGKRLDRDPYALPPYSRDLCKETFQRLMNRTAKKGGVNIRKPKEHSPPTDIPYAKFLRDYQSHLGEVAAYLGKGIGLILQRADSEIALSILDELDKAGITALPVHDSFIVKIDDKDASAATMRKVCADTYGIQPELTFSKPD